MTQGARTVALLSSGSVGFMSGVLAKTYYGSLHV